MLSRFARLLLTLTALAPVALVHAFALIGTAPWSAIWPWAVGAVALAALCDAILRHVGRTAETEPLTVRSTRIADHHVLSFILAYLLPLLTPRDVDAAPYALLAVLLLIGAVLYQANLIHINPLLFLLFGYHFYQVTTPGGSSFLLLSRGAPREIAGRIRVKRMSSTTFLQVHADGDAELLRPDPRTPAGGAPPPDDEAHRQAGDE